MTRRLALVLCLLAILLVTIFLVLRWRCAAFYDNAAWYCFRDSEQRPAEALVEIQQLAGLIDTYRIINGRLPEHLDELLEPSPVPAVAHRIPRDPWGSSYIYERRGGSDYLLRSPGPDRVANTPDDLVHEFKGPE